MESLERKDTNPVPEEPIKSEGMVPSPSTSDRSNSAGSPPPHCSICLGKLINTSFTDSCLHQFCFTCLLQWSKIKTECPLCKQTFKSIIHNVRSEGDYDQYDVNLQAVAATLDVAIGFPPQQWDVVRGIQSMPRIVSPARNFMYRTTMAPHRHRFNPLLNADAVARREQLPSHPPQVSREEIRRRSHDPLDFRRQVYRQGIWAADLPDAFGRFRETSASYYQRHPEETHRLVPWLNRELQVLLNNNRSHIAYVMSIIMDAITRHDIYTPDFRNAIRPYFGVHTDQFVHEFSNYARSNFDMIGYDQSVVYHPHRGLTNDYVPRTVSPPSSSTSDSDSDSDVRLVEDERDNRLGMNTLSVGPHTIDMPGPSTVGHALQFTLPSYLRVVQMPPVIYTISSTSSESENECEVIGFVKPRHERTPEIIDLDSDENEPLVISGPSTSAAPINEPEVPVPVVEEVVPGPSINSLDLNNSRRTRQLDDEASRCCMYEFSSSSTANTDESDSDYNPQSKSRRRKKKSSKSSPRKFRTRKHKKSTGTVRKREKSRRERVHSEAESEATDMPSTSRGTKRYISDHSESEKPTKKSKKSKKTKSSKKSKKTKSKTPRYIMYSNSSSSSSESGAESRVKKKEEDSYEYSKEEEEPRYAESEGSSRLRIDENSRNSHSSDQDNDEDDDDEHSSVKLKSVVTAAPARDSHSSESEQSASTKTSRGRYRSHKKRKESKKRRRSRS